MDGHRWTAVLAWGAVALAVIATLLVSVLSGWRAAAVIAAGVGFLVAVAVLIVEDSVARRRSGWRWLAACILLSAAALIGFVVVAVYDRLHGRRGIEARWAPAGRWYMLGGLVLAVAAVAVASSQVQVPGASVSVPGASGSFSGSCSSALQVFLGAGPYGPSSALPKSVPQVLTAAQAAVAGRCSAAAAHRMTASAICLGGALLFAVAGQGMNRRRGDRQRRETLALP